MTSSANPLGPVRPAVAADHAAWVRLFAAYAAFYEVAQTPEHRATVWGWITDPDHDVKALILTGNDGQPVGFAHYRPFALPLAASTGCFLDDLFIDSAHRGGGGVNLLLGALRELARQNGWSVIRWITADDNYRARSVYDRVATRTSWITYDMDVG